MNERKELRKSSSKKTEHTILSLRETHFSGQATLYRERLLNTVKAPKFGLHGNFGPLFQKGPLSLKRILQKNEENKTLDLQFFFCSYFVHDSSKETTELAKKVQSSHEVQS